MFDARARETLHIQAIDQLQYCNNNNKNDGKCQ